MNRRSFLGILGLGGAAAAVATVIPKLAEPVRRKYAKTSIDKQDELAGGWVSYKYQYKTLMAPNVKQRIRFIDEP